MAEAQLATVKEELRLKQEELDQALDREQRWIATHPLGIPPNQPGAIPAGPMMQLKPPAIEEYSGNRQRTLDFCLAVDTRLRATSQYKSLVGLEFAVGHFTDDAATWWRYLRDRHPEIDSWEQLRPFLLREFELPNEQALYEQRLVELTQTGSVDAYVTEFLEIARRLMDLPDGFLQRCFIRGLSRDMRVRMADKTFASLRELTVSVSRIAALLGDDM